MKDSKPLCSEDCWHYGVFGGTEGCEAVHTPWPELRQPGEKCLYPDKKDICPSVIIDTMGFCAALEGEVIKGGPHDNTQLVKMLTSS